MPRFVFFSAGFSSINNLSSTGSGAMDENGNQFATSTVNNANGNFVRFITDSCIAVLSTPGGSIAYGDRASFVSMDSDGFTVNFTTTSNGRPMSACVYP